MCECVCVCVCVCVEPPHKASLADQSRERRVAWRGVAPSPTSLPSPYDLMAHSAFFPLTSLPPTGRPSLLAVGNLRDGNVFRDVFLARVPSSGAPTPLMNFIRFLLLTLEVWHRITAW